MASFTMARKRKKFPRKPRAPRTWEARADRRTASFITQRLEEIQEELCDLIPDLKTFGHFDQIGRLMWAVDYLHDLQKKYRKLSDGFTWEEED